MKRLISFDRRWLRFSVIADHQVGLGVQVFWNPNFIGLWIWLACFEIDLDLRFRP